MAGVIDADVGSLHQPVALVHDSDSGDSDPRSGFRIIPPGGFSGIPSAAILFRILHPTLDSTRCPCSVRLRIAGPMMAL